MGYATIAGDAGDHRPLHDPDPDRGVRRCSDRRGTWWSGADSATAAILAAGLAGMAQPGSAEYVAFAGIVAIFTGGLLILARLLRLGFLADFLSRSVLIGFLTGVGIQVAMGQVPGMLGVPGGTGGTIRSSSARSRTSRTRA